MAVALLEENPAMTRETCDQDGERARPLRLPSTRASEGFSVS